MPTEACPRPVSSASGDIRSSQSLSISTTAKIGFGFTNHCPKILYSRITVSPLPAWFVFVLHRALARDQPPREMHLKAHCVDFSASRRKDLILQDCFALVG